MVISNGHSAAKANGERLTQQLHAGWQRFFGYDFFISYAWIDGRKYAEALAQRLTNLYRYRCFLDDREMGGGDAWRISVRRALGRSSVLVLVATPAALERDNVFDELQIFARRGRPMVPIDLAERVAMLSSDHRLYPLLEERIRIAEPLASNGVMTNAPSDSVISFLNSSFRFMRISRIRTLILGVAVAFFAVLSISLVFLAVLERMAAERARQNEQTATAQRERAERALVASANSAIELLQTIIGNYDKWVSADSVIAQAVVEKSEELVTKFIMSPESAPGFVNVKGIAILALSSVMEKKGDLQQAKKYAEDAVFWARETSKVVPDEASLFGLHATALSELAEINLKMGDSASFTANYSTALKLLRDALSANIFLDVSKVEQSRIYRKYTQSLMRTDKLTEAEKVLIGWVETLDERAANEVETPDILDDLAEAHLRLFAISSGLERTDENANRMLVEGRRALFYLNRLSAKRELTPDQRRYLSRLQSVFGTSASHGSALE